MTSDTGGHQVEQQSFLGFPARPGGDGGVIQAGRHCWYELAGEIQGAFLDIDRAVAGMRWSGDARNAFNAVWSQLSGHGTEASQHSHDMGDHLFKLGSQIQDAQNEWDLAMAGMVATTAISIGLTFFTFGISDAVAAGAAATVVGTMEGICVELDIALDVAVQALMDAIRVAAQLAVKFTLQFAVNVVSEGTANLVDGRGLGNVDLRQAAVSAIGGGRLGAEVRGEGVSAVVGREGEAVVSGEDDVVAELDQVEQSWRARLIPEQAGKPPTIDESAKRFSEKERSVAELLNSEGHQVTAVAEGADRTPDALVDGEPTEFKSLDSGATNATVKNALNSAKGQSGHIIVDARASGLTEAEALRGLRRFLGVHSSGVSGIRIIGVDFELRYP